MRGTPEIGNADAPITAFPEFDGYRTLTCARSRPNVSTHMLARVAYSELVSVMTVSALNEFGRDRASRRRVGGSGRMPSLRTGGCRSRIPVNLLAYPKELTMRGIVVAYRHRAPRKRACLQSHCAKRGWRKPFRSMPTKFRELALLSGRPLSCSA